MAGSNAFDDDSEVEVFEVSFGGESGDAETPKPKGRGFFKSLIAFLGLKPKGPHVAKKPVEKKPGLFLKKIFDSFGKKENIAKKPGVVASQSEVVKLQPEAAKKVELVSAKSGVVESQPAVVRKVEPVFVKPKIADNVSIGLKDSVEKKRRSDAAIKSWKERKERAERLLAQLERLEKKERERQLSEIDLVDKKNLSLQLSEIKNDLAKVSSDFESGGLSQLRGIQVILGEISKHESIEEQIEFCKKMQKQLEFEFYKRRISDSEFKKSFLEYEQKIAELELKKKTRFAEAKNVSVQNISSAPGIVIAGGVQGSGSNIGVSSIGGIDEKFENLKVLAEKPSSFGKIVVSQKQPPVRESEKVVSKSESESVQSFENESSQAVVESSSVSANVDSNKLLNKMDKLVDLMEQERKLKAELNVSETKPMGDVSFAITGAKREKIETVEKEVAVKKIVTDFDRILDFVKSRGKVSVLVISKEFSLKAEKVMEIIETLEVNNLVRIEYPSIGPANVFDINFGAEKNRGS